MRRQVERTATLDVVVPGSSLVNAGPTPGIVATSNIFVSTLAETSHDSLWNAWAEHADRLTQYFDQFDHDDVSEDSTTDFDDGGGEIDVWKPEIDFRDRDRPTTLF